MDSKECVIAREDKPLRQDSVLKKIPLAIRKDSERSMKCNGSDRDSNRSPTISGSKEGETSGNKSESRDGLGPMVPPKVPKKIINNWKQACDKTKDKTKELLKKWRTLPDPEQAENSILAVDDSVVSLNAVSSGWREHVWTTWVKRTPDGDECSSFDATAITLTEFQVKKLSHFFISFLDLDRDDVISLADFDAFSERLRHFSDWSKSSTQYHRLKEVQRGFIEFFLLPEDMQNTMHSYKTLEKKLNKEQLSMEQWLSKWNSMLEKFQNYHQLPLWLQYFPKLLFHVINKSGSGYISRNELNAFYASILGLTAVQIEAFLDEAYRALTSNEEQPLIYTTFRLCFANFLLARHPNGPGQYLLGPLPGNKTTFFPIDYKALCYAPEELEQYGTAVKTNRRSVIV